MLPSGLNSATMYTASSTKKMHPVHVALYLGNPWHSEVHTPLIQTNNCLALTLRQVEPVVLQLSASIPRQSQLPVRNISTKSNGAQCLRHRQRKLIAMAGWSVQLLGLPCVGIAIYPSLAGDSKPCEACHWTIEPLPAQAGPPPKKRHQNSNSVWVEPKSRKRKRLNTKMNPLCTNLHGLLISYQIRLGCVFWIILAILGLSFRYLCEWLPPWHLAMNFKTGKTSGKRWNPPSCRFNLYKNRDSRHESMMDWLCSHA